LGKWFDEKSKETYIKTENIEIVISQQLVKKIILYFSKINKKS
jgi:hypothetical protein